LRYSGWSPVLSRGSGSGSRPACGYHARISSVGAFLFPLGIGGVIIGGHDRFQPVVVAGALTVLLGMLLFVAIVFRTTRERRQVPKAAAGRMSGAI
jgi:hypothetical protein